jgi:hypothetical protein
VSRRVVAVTLALALGGVGVAAVALTGGDDGREASPPAVVQPAASPCGPPPDRGNGNCNGRRGGPPREQDAPAPRAAATDVAQTSARVLGDRLASGEKAVIGASCSDDACIVRYRSKPRGTGAVIGAQRPLRDALFADPSIRRVTFYVHHKAGGTPKKDERPAFMAVTCVRGRACTSRHVAGGKLRSDLRRGRITLEEARSARDE